MATVHMAGGTAVAKIGNGNMILSNSIHPVLEKKNLTEHVQGDGGRQEIALKFKTSLSSLMTTSFSMFRPVTFILGFF